jgi:hypothetical protein
VLFLCALKKIYLTLLRHFQTASVDEQDGLLRILAEWQDGDVLVCFSPDRYADFFFLLLLPLSLL